MKTKCIIVDDEPIARKIIASYLKNFENIEIVAECKNAVQAFEIIKQQNIDLMFLDIQMPQITGLVFLKTLSLPPKVIITTAYRDYAIEGYELEITDYLLKPISFERFLKAINKYYKTVDNIEPLQQNNTTLPENEFIYIKENKKTRKLLLANIQYLESMREYVKIHTTEGKFTTKGSLIHFDSLLPSGIFIRIHKSFIISLSHIKSFNSTHVEIAGTELPISRSYKIDVMKAFNFNEPRQ